MILFQLKVNDLERKLKVAEDELHEVKVSSRVATSRRAVLTGRRAKSANGAPRIWKEPADSVDVTDGWILNSVAIVAFSPYVVVVQTRCSNRLKN